MTAIRPQPEPQTHAAELVERCGWIDLATGTLLGWALLFVWLAPVLAGTWTWMLEHCRLSLHCSITGASVSETLVWLSANCGLIPDCWLTVSALAIAAFGGYFVIAGCRNMESTAPVLLWSMLPVPCVLTFLVWTQRIPCAFGLTLAFLDFVGHFVMLAPILWTRRPAPAALAYEDDPNIDRISSGAWLGRIVGKRVAPLFGLVSALRAARTFHPDGVIITGTAEPLDGLDNKLQNIADHLTGRVIMRFGPGIDSRFQRQGFTVVNPPNVAARFEAPDGGSQLDLLTLSLGSRIRQLLPYVFIIKFFDYFRNKYSPMVRYHTPGGGPDVWFRIEPAGPPPPFSPLDPAGREAELLEQVGQGRALFVTVRYLDSKAWIPIAKFGLDAIDNTVDQEKLHYDPFGGRGFEPYGFFTELRRAVYPASVAARPKSNAERNRRRLMSLGQRFALYLDGPEKGGVGAQ